MNWQMLKLRLANWLAPDLITQLEQARDDQIDTYLKLDRSLECTRKLAGRVAGMQRDIDKLRITNGELNERLKSARSHLTQRRRKSK